MCSGLSEQSPSALKQWYRWGLLQRIQLCLACIVLPAPSLSHGINGHIHVTAWSLAEIQVSELLAIFDDPSAVDAFLFGAAFPDTGYATENGYGEIAHWEPFVDAFLDHLRHTYPPPFDDPDVRRIIAFTMGMASHGLQDEIFDTLFLPQIAVHDGAGQDAADPGTDAFLYTDGHLEFRPEAFAPTADLIEVFSECHDHTVTEQEMRAGMARVKLFVIDTFEGIADGIYDMYRPQLEWTSMHYMDPTVPGSLTSEIPATAAYIEAVWARLNGAPPIAARVVHTYPDRNAFVRNPDGLAVDRWITLVFGMGVRTGSLSPATVELRDASGERLGIDIEASRWTQNPDSVGRLLVLKPRRPLQHAQTYTVHLRPGLEYVNGDSLDTEWRLDVRTPCVDEDDPRCAPLPQTMFEVDAGVSDIDVIKDAEPHSDDLSVGQGAQSSESSKGGGCASVSNPTVPGLAWCLLVMWFMRRRSCGTRPIQK